jgi:HPr kinase/phosphorylase
MPLSISLAVQHSPVPMRLHASCAARDACGVLLLGPSGSGKSDLLLRLLDRGFALVADDQVEVEDGIASAPAALAGLVEVRGLGIVRLPCITAARLALAVRLRAPGERLPDAARPDPLLAVPCVALDPWTASAPLRVSLALDCALGRTAQVAGAFA